MAKLSLWCRQVACPWTALRFHSVWDDRPRIMGTMESASARSGPLDNFPLLSASFLPVLRFRRAAIPTSQKRLITSPKTRSTLDTFGVGGVLLACGSLLQLFQLRHCGGRIVFPFIGFLASFAFSLRVALAHLSFLLAPVYNQA